MPFFALKTFLQTYTYEVDKGRSILNLNDAISELDKRNSSYGNDDDDGDDDNNNNNNNGKTTTTTPYADILGGNNSYSNIPAYPCTCAYARVSNTWLKQNLKKQ